MSPVAGISTVQAADVVVGVPNWPSAAATASILKVVLEDNLGLKVELQNGTNPVIFEAMDTGSMHVHPEVWLPNQTNLHDKYVKSKGTVRMSPNGVPSFQGMCVTKASAERTGIKAIADLADPDMAKNFDSNGDGLGEVWVGASGWASTNIEKIRAR
ncbi:MAG: amino acid-binding protein, partial [Alphaproteobacteria bacterium]|nr:amino acid-binding protein [Alphaproteobacteria bacterium]